MGPHSLTTRIRHPTSTTTLIETKAETTTTVDKVRITETTAVAKTATAAKEETTAVDKGTTTAAQVAIMEVGKGTMEVEAVVGTILITIMAAAMVINASSLRMASSAERTINKIMGKHQQLEVVLVDLAPLTTQLHSISQRLVKIKTRATKVDVRMEGMAVTKHTTKETAIRTAFSTVVALAASLVAVLAAIRKGVEVRVTMQIPVKVYLAPLRQSPTTWSSHLFQAEVLEPDSSGEPCSVTITRGSLRKDRTWGMRVSEKVQQAGEEELKI